MPHPFVLSHIFARHIFSTAIEINIELHFDLQVSIISPI